MIDQELFKVLSNIKDEETMQRFLTEILTKKEIKDLTLRWELLQLIQKKIPQRTIAKKLGISLCKITRGAKLLKDKTTATYSLLNDVHQEP
jgi:TrpR family transcriptional regulator, trp operon repressor